MGILFMFNIKTSIMDVKKLIEKTVLLLQEAKYSTSRIYTYRWLWSKGIVPYMQALGQNDFTENVGKEFMQTCHEGGFLTCHHRDLVKSVDVLICALLNKSIIRRISHAVPYNFSGEIGNVTNLYLLYLKDLRLNSKTIRAHEKRLYIFVEYLKSTNIHVLSDITEDVIVDYIMAHEYRRIEYLRSLRAFLRFLYSNRLIEKDWSYVIKSLGKKYKHVRVSSFYSPEEIVQLEESISRSSNIGKRDYAMVMLCSRLGLRVSDVANLEFSNIDWENNKINIVQYKTGIPLSLPLLPEVGNAIIDYLKYGRKESSCNKIFTSLRPPYEEMTPSSVHAAIAVAFQNSGLRIDNRRHGGHSLRFSLAQRMLNNSTPISIISEALGHQQVDVTRTYVRIDLNHMRECVLDVPDVSVDFYTQKGGCFYE